MIPFEVADSHDAPRVLTPAMVEALYGIEPSIRRYLRLGYERGFVAIFVGFFGEDYAEVECAHEWNDARGAMECARALREYDRTDRSWR